MKVLGTPIEGVTDWITELALVFAAEAKDEATALSRIGNLEAEAKGLAEKMAGENAEIERLKPHIEEKEGELAELTAKYSRFHYKSKIGAGMLIASVLLLFAGGTGFFLAAIWVGLFLWERSKRGKLLPPIQEELDGLTGRASELLESVAAAEARTSEIVAEVASLQPEQGVEAIGRVYYPMVSTDVAGYPVLIDGAGLEQSVELQIADLISDPDAIKKIKSTVESASSRPTLLQARSECGREVDSLQGEESDLREAVESFTDVVDSIPQLSAQVRLLPNGRGLVKEFSENQDQVRDEDVPGLVLSAGDEEQTKKSIEQITAVTNRMRSAGGDAAQVLRGTYDGLQSVLDDYRSLRSDALESLHDNFLGIVSKAEMTQVTYYCPKCNRLPQYLYSKLGINLKDAHQEDQREVYRRLIQDDEIKTRLTDDESILRGMSEALQGLRQTTALLQQRSNDTAASGTAAIGAVDELGSARQAAQEKVSLQKQHDKLLETYQGCLRKAVTGSERPRLELSTQARLFLDPREEHKNIWTCAACNAQFSEPREYNMGRMLKYKEHLLLPMWNHLWTEKADFRKQELFRTNEAVQRMNEKESEKLINIADQYRSDMRPVRENLVKAAAEAGNKTEQLFDTIQGLSDIGLLTPEDGDKARREMKEQLGEDLGTSKQKAENNELILTREPQAQAQRRKLVEDPQQRLQVPELLLFNEAPRGVPIRLQPAGVVQPAVIEADFDDANPGENEEVSDV